jgi:hypothetical protein
MMLGQPMAIVLFTIQRHHKAYGGRPFLIDQMSASNAPSLTVPPPVLLT